MSPGRAGDRTVAGGEARIRCMMDAPPTELDPMNILLIPSAVLAAATGLYVANEVALRTQGTVPSNWRRHVLRSHAIRKRQLELMAGTGEGTRAHVLRGTVDGRGVQVRVTNTELEVRASIPRSAPYKLEIRRETLADRLSLEPDIALGDDELDRLLQVRGRDEERIAAVLAYPTMADALRCLFTEDLVVAVAARRVIVRKRHASPEEVERAIQGAVDLANALGESRTVWDDVSAAHRLRFSEGPDRKALHGEVGGAPFTLESKRREGMWHTAAWVEVPGLSPDIAFMRGKGDLGDPILDRFFRGEGNRAALRALVTRPGFDEVRGELLEAADQWPIVHVQDGRATVADRDVAHKDLPALVASAIGLGRALVAVTGPPTPARPTTRQG